MTQAGSAQAEPNPPIALGEGVLRAMRRYSIPAGPTSLVYCTLYELAQEAIQQKALDVVSEYQDRLATDIVEQTTMGGMAALEAAKALLKALQAQIGQSAGLC